MIEQIAYVIALLGFGLFAINQVRKPTTMFGELFVTIMGASHSKLTDWGLEHVAVGERFTILDVGCGGGRTVEKLAGRTQGVVHGVDFAKGSVMAARRTNAQLIQEGRVAIEQASVSKLPFSDDTFDLVTAIETQYYWPNLVEDMAEILRTLKPGGTAIVINEGYGKGGLEKLAAPVMKLMRAANLTADEQETLFTMAGYGDIETHEEPEHGWLCAIGKKPAEELRRPVNGAAH